MRVTRRTLIKSGAVVTALAGPNALSARTPTVTIFDSRHASSKAFARGRTGKRIDVAHQDATFWRDLRSGLPQGRIEGLTSWSDLVFVRGLLEEQGKRLTQERTESGLFRWTMA